MYSEEDLLMISALQHLAFCERQCALIHLEQQWAENRFTVLGEILHEKAHQVSNEKRNDIIIARSLRLVSLQLGLTGQADIVEFHHLETNDTGITIQGKKGRWIPFPVEYKKGKPKSDNIDTVQLCAQALCLEEQLNTEIKEGALFYGDKRKRLRVKFDKELRNETEQLSQRLHQLIEAAVTPKPQYTAKCKSCSLIDSCNPKLPTVIKRTRYEALLFSEDE